MGYVSRSSPSLQRKESQAMNIRHNTKNETYILPDNKMRYFAVLRPSDNKADRFLLVAFQDINERDTFVNHTAFETMPAARLSKLKKDAVHACRNNPTVVFDQNANPVIRITSLYKSLWQQRTDRPEDGYIPEKPVMNKGAYYNGKSKHVRFYR